MKKLFISILLVLASIFSFSQSSTYYATYVKRAEKNSYTDKYVWDEGKKINLKIVFLDNFIRVYDNAESHYVLKGDEKKSKTDKYEMSYWDATDEKGRKVDVSIIHYFNSGEVVLMIVYDDIAFGYSMDMGRLSPLNN